MAFSFIFIIAMNCYLRWLKKTGEFCFATQLFTTVLKSKLSDMILFPSHWKKTGDLKWHPNCPLDSLLRNKLEIVCISQTKLAQHRPVVLNLFDLWPFKQTVHSSVRSTIGKREEWWALICLFIARLLGLIIQKGLESDCVSKLEMFYLKPATI